MDGHDATHNPLLSNSSFNWKNAVACIGAGGSAGISVDLALFPIDTIKSRLQASTKKVDYTKEAKNVSKYRGFLSAMLASFPCAAMFWVSYEFSKY